MPSSVKSFAKINIGLYIGPPEMRSDGFHELRTVYQTIALHDTIKVEFKRNMSGIEIRCKDKRVPEDESNTCCKMADRVMKALKLRGRVIITIDKKLPIQGGLGAASANAVATLIAIEREVKRRVEPAERIRICAEVGSDVPLFLLGGTILGLGRGESVYPMPDLPELDVVVATPEVGVSTPKAFAAWDRLFDSDSTIRQMTKSGQSDTLNRFSQCVYEWLDGYCCSPVSGVSTRGGNRAEPLLLDLVRTGIENDFERVVFPQFPELRDVKRVLEHAGANYASLSGSGSTVYGLFADKAAAAKAVVRLATKGIPAVATKTLSRQKYWQQMLS
jgi:4-diphosphocytidyl-2-C-methyl-D-erythritol kinase